MNKEPILGIPVSPPPPPAPLWNANQNGISYMPVGGDVWQATIWMTDQAGVLYQSLPITLYRKG